MISSNRRRRFLVQVYDVSEVLVKFSIIYLVVASIHTFYTAGSGGGNRDDRLMMRNRRGRESAMREKKNSREIIREK